MVMAIQARRAMAAITTMPRQPSRLQAASHWLLGGCVSMGGGGSGRKTVRSLGGRGGSSFGNVGRTGIAGGSGSVRVTALGSGGGDASDRTTSAIGKSPAAASTGSATTGRDRGGAVGLTSSANKGSSSSGSRGSGGGGGGGERSSGKLIHAPERRGAALGFASGHST